MGRGSCCVAYTGLGLAAVLWLQPRTADQGVMVHVYNPHTKEVETEGSELAGVLDQPNEQGLSSRDRH